MASDTARTSQKPVWGVARHVLYVENLFNGFVEKLCNSEGKEGLESQFHRSAKCAFQTGRTGADEVSLTS